MTLLALRGYGAMSPHLTGGSDNPASPGLTVTLAWDLELDPAISGYRLYAGTASRNYSAVYEPGNTNNITVSGLQDGTVYFFAVTAYNTNGLESDFSAELVYTNSTIPAAPRITNLVKMADGNFNVSGIAAPGKVCLLLGATNLAPPVTWTSIATNTVTAQATFTITDMHATNYPRRFYRVWQTGTAVGPAAIAASAQ